MGWSIWGLNQVQISPGDHAASCLTGVLRGNSQGVKLSTHLHRVPRLRMSGSIPLLSPMCPYGMDKNNFSVYIYLEESQQLICWRHTDTSSASVGSLYMSTWHRPVYQCSVQVTVYSALGSSVSYTSISEQKAIPYFTKAIFHAARFPLQPTFSHPHAVTRLSLRAESNKMAQSVTHQEGLRLECWPPHLGS